MHQVKCLVDVAERHGVRDQIVNVDLAVHVPIHDLGYIGSSSRTTESRAAPHATRIQLERAGRDLGPRWRYTDNDTLTPAFVAALQCLPHHFDVAYTFETVIGTAPCEFHQIIHKIAFDLSGIDEMGCAELFRQCLPSRVQIHPDDLVGADKPGTLNDVQSDAAQSKDHHICTWLYASGVDHGTDSGSHPATDVTDLVERSVLADFGHGNFRQNRKIGESRCAHVMKQGVITKGKTAAFIRHQTPSLGLTH